MISTPRNCPSKYLKHGSGAYKILCFAKFRKDNAFTSADYRNFYLGQVTAKRVDANLQSLTKQGYLEKWDHPNPPKTCKYGVATKLYRITLDGHHALLVLGRQRRLQEERIRQQNMNTDGLRRWNKERKLLGFQIQTK
jgi:hypothetical protein